MGTSKLLWGHPYKMLGGNLQWTSISSRGSRNTPNQFILQKPEISASPDEPSALPNYDWGRLYKQGYMEVRLSFYRVPAAKISANSRPF